MMEENKVYQVYDTLNENQKIELINIIDGEKLRVYDAWKREKERAMQSFKKTLSPYDRLLFELMIIETEF